MNFYGNSNHMFRFISLRIFADIGVIVVGTSKKKTLNLICLKLEVERNLEKLTKPKSSLIIVLNYNTETFLHTVNLM